MSTRSVALRAIVLSFGLAASSPTRAAEVSPEPAKPALPAGWKLAPVTTHPFFLFGPEDVPALKARLTNEFGSLNNIGDPQLTAFLAGDERSRRKATADFLTYWHNYAKRWRNDNLNKPEWIDGVALRGIRHCLITYDLVASYGYLTEGESREFRDSMVRSIEFALTGDYKNPRITPVENFRMRNIWTDVVAAAGLVGLAFPDLPQSRSWIEFAAAEINRQFDRGIWDGCWNESPRYQAAMILITGTYYHVLERRTGIDLFNDPRYVSMLEWFIRFETPPDKLAGKSLGYPKGVILLPGIGDSSWTNVSFGVPALFASHYIHSNPELAGRIIGAWRMAGSPYQGDCVESAQTLIDSAIPPRQEVLASDFSPGKGYIVMRSSGAADQTWFLLHCGKASLGGHDHADANGFNLYSKGIPLALDSASGSYSDPVHHSWNVTALAHNTVVFGERSQEKKDGAILTWATGPEADYCVADASVPSGVKTFIRHVLFAKHRDYFVIWDQIECSEPTRWMMHTPATQFEWSDHRVRCLTSWGENVDVTAVWPQTQLQAGTKKGKYSDWMIGIHAQQDHHPFQYQDYFGIPNEPGKDFLVVLNPSTPGQAPLTVRDVSGPEGPALEITEGGQTDRVELHSTSAELRLGSQPPIHLASPRS